MALFIQAVLQVLVPLYLLVSLLRAGDDKALLVIRLFSVLAWILLIRHASLWVTLPYTLCYFYALLAILLSWWKVYFSQASLREGWSRGNNRRVIASGLVLLCLVALNGWILQARQVDEELVVDVQFPFGSGSYYVANGGALGILNFHHLTLGKEPQYLEARGQSFGVDIVAIDKYGSISQNFLLEDLDSHQIFGRPVLAPCTGKILAAENRLKDQRVGTVDREHMAGNHVLIDCGPFEVLLAHLQSGSVEVLPGQNIDAGAIIGRVGNTGNSDLPHLHIHAQRRGAETALAAGEPLELRLDGRYLIRGDVVRL